MEFDGSSLLFLLMYVFEYPEVQLFAIILIVCIVVSAVNRKKLTSVQYEIIVNGNTIRNKTKEGRELSITINEIVTVKDNWDYYSFTAKNTRATYMFTCQKDLLHKVVGRI